MEHDYAAEMLGIELVEVAAGSATMSMKIRRDMLNAHAICHGGIIFSLADTVFAHACNSRNRKTLALSCTINFTESAKEGDLLTATAKEVSLQGRTGLYDITVKNQNDREIAFFRGSSYGTSSAVI